VTFIHVEGLKLDADAAERGIAEARKAIAAIAGLPEAAAA
jgi:FMN-dependent NADH-azoreductase